MTGGFKNCVSDLYKGVKSDNEFMGKMLTAGTDDYTRDCEVHLDPKDCDEGFSPYFMGLSDHILSKHGKGGLATEYPEKYQAIQRKHLKDAEFFEMNLCGGVNGRESDYVSPTTKSLLNLSQNIDVDFRLPSMDEFKSMWVFNPEHNWIQNLIKILNLAVIAVIIYMVASVFLKFMSRGKAVE